MPPAQLAEPMPKRQQQTAAHVDLSQETLSLAAAARLLDHTENELRLLCRKGVLPSSAEAGGQLRIAVADLIDYRHHRDNMLEHFERSPLGRVDRELMASGQYWGA